MRVWFVSFAPLRVLWIKLSVLLRDHLSAIYMMNHRQISRQWLDQLIKLMWEKNWVRSRGVKSVLTVLHLETNALKHTLSPPYQLMLDLEHRLSSPCRRRTFYHRAVAFYWPGWVRRTQGCGDRGQVILFWGCRRQHQFVWGSGILAGSCCILTFKVAPSFWFLNINMPIFLMKPFSNCLRKTWLKFLGGPSSKCWPNSMPGFVCIAMKKRFFEKKISKWPVTPTFFSESLFS